VYKINDWSGVWTGHKIPTQEEHPVINQSTNQYSFITGMPERTSLSVTVSQCHIRVNLIGISCKPCKAQTADFVLVAVG